MSTHSLFARAPSLAACAWIAAAAPVAGAQAPPEVPAEVPSEEPPPPAAEGRADSWDEWGYGRESFSWRSEDGRGELELGGLIRAEARWNGAERKPQSDYGLNRARLDLRGRFEDLFRFRLQPDFGETTEDGVELEEAWVGADLFSGSARFMAGRARVPFGLEEMRRQEFIDLPRLSIAHQLTPGPDAGLFLFGLTERGRFEWNVGVANGTGGADPSGDKDFAARLAVHPFRDDTGRSPPRGLAGALEHLHVGAALTAGTEDQDIGGETIDNAVGLPLMVYADGVRLDGTRVRLGLEAAWYHGPWFAQGELMRVSQEMAYEGQSVDTDINAGYLDLSYALTGEEHGYDGVTPRAPVGQGGAGAWLLALRYSELHTEGELAAEGFLLPDTWVGRVRTVELGLDWVLTRNAMVRAAFVRSMYSNDVLVGGELVDSENAAILQFQVSF
jgi:phosphate-selective porin OprO/OprP